MVVSIVRSVAAAVLIAATLVTSGQAADEATLGPEITRLVELLDRGTPSERSAAERELVELGLAPGNSETLLKLLPMPNDDMSQEAATRLARIRGQVQTRMAEQAVAETRVTLDVTDALLADVLKEIEKQTGNRVVDYREQFGEEAPEKKLTLKIDDQPFWAAMDQILSVRGRRSDGARGPAAGRTAAGRRRHLRRAVPHRADTGQRQSQRADARPERA
jgi:hypothetical protein